MDEMTRRRFLVTGIEAFAFAASCDAAGIKPPSYPLKAVLFGADTARGKELLKWAKEVPGFAMMSALDSAADLAPVLSDATVQAIVCATPPERHAEIACAALKAGKSVFVDPPVGLSDAECAAVETAAAASKGVYFYGDKFAASTCYKPGIEAVLNGAIGEVREAKSWDHGEHYGVFHEFARKALGIDGEPTKVARFLDADGCGLTRLDYPGGKSLTLERPSRLTRNCGLYLLDMPCASVVYGTTGSMVFATNDRALLFDRNGVLAKYWEGRDPESVAFAGSLEVPLRNLDIRQLAHFAACVNDRELRPYATLEDALAVRRRYAAYA